MKQERLLYGDGVGSVSLVESMGVEMTIVNSARVSLGKHNHHIDLTKRDIKLIRYLIENRHTSTLEHCVVTFRIKVPLFVRSQHHRHRTWSFNEISRRYTDDGLEFYTPETFRSQHLSNRQASNLDKFNPILPSITGDSQDACEALRAHVLDCVDLFESMIDAGIAREQARMVLPQNLYTEYYGTVNLNNLIKFIGLRITSHAQWEIRMVALRMLEIAGELWPQVVGPLLDRLYIVELCELRGEPEPAASKIEHVIKKLRACWSSGDLHYLRLGQLLANVIGDADLASVSDERLLTHLENFANERQ